MTDDEMRGAGVLGARRRARGATTLHVRSTLWLWA